MIKEKIYEYVNYLSFKNLVNLVLPFFCERVHKKKVKVQAKPRAARLFFYENDRFIHKKKGMTNVVSM
jgi:hypothetical protein